MSINEYFHLCYVKMSRLGEKRGKESSVRFKMIRLYIFVFSLVPFSNQYLFPHMKNLIVYNSKQCKRLPCNTEVMVSKNYSQMIQHFKQIIKTFTRQKDKYHNKKNVKKTLKRFLPNRVLIDGLLGFVLFFFNSADKEQHTTKLIGASETINHYI